MRRNRFIGLAVCVLIAACGQESPSRSTDWVLTNGRIYTVDEEQPWAETGVDSCLAAPGVDRLLAHLEIRSNF